MIKSNAKAPAPSVEASPAAASLEKAKVPQPSVEAASASDAPPGLDGPPGFLSRPIPSSTGT
jgi:hypothetical protein